MSKKAKGIKTGQKQKKRNRPHQPKGKKTIGGKTVLFVDDEYNSRKRYVPAMENAGTKVLPAKSLEEALDILEKKAQEIDFAVLDLHIPPIPSKLEHYTNQIHLTTNQGQTLGIFLSETHPHIKYVYLSLVPNSVCHQTKSQKKISVIDKNTTLSKKLPDTLLEIDYLFEPPLQEKLS